MDHVFVTVIRRRWCVCCDLTQTRASNWVAWPKAGPCANDQPAAVDNRAARALLPERVPYHERLDRRIVTEDDDYG